MTDELKQEIESARELARTGDYNEHPCEIGYAETIVDLAEALAARDALIAELEGFLLAIEKGTYPRPVGKSWRADDVPSKHDRCVHDVWMYETCEGCLDAFVRQALETKHD